MVVVGVRTWRTVMLAKVIQRAFLSSTKVICKLLSTTSWALVLINRTRPHKTCCNGIVTFPVFQVCVNNVVGWSLDVEI